MLISGLTLPLFAQQLFAIVGLSCLLNLVLTRTLPQGDSVLPCPRWVFWLSLTYQWVVFPYLFYVSYSESGHNMDQMLFTSWQECSKDTCWMRVFVFVFLGYLVKDIWYCSPLEIVHHVAGITFFSLVLVAPAGAHAFTISCFLLEFANGFLNFSWLLHHTPWWQSAAGLAVVMFTVVHIPALYLLYRLCTEPTPESSPTLYWVLFVVASVVCLIRTTEILKTYHLTVEWTNKQTTKKE